MGRDRADTLNLQDFGKPSSKMKREQYQSLVYNGAAGSSGGESN
jgi:hypothetical protein